MTSVAGAQSPVDKFAPDPDNSFGVKPLGDEITDIEAECGFWTQTPELAYICAVAHRRNVGRWPLLGFVLGNLLSWVPPYVVLPDADGSTSSVGVAGSLNFFVHVVAESGEGKSRLLGVANEIVPPNVSRYDTPAACIEPQPDLLTSGTGEGLCKHFVGLAKDPKAAKDPNVTDVDKRNAPKIMVQKTDVGVVEVDEVSTYLGELARTTSKAAGVFTSLWSGKAAGTNTGGEDARTKVPAHAVRLIVKLLGQPGLCSRLFTDDLVEGGNPAAPIVASRR